MLPVGCPAHVGRCSSQIGNASQVVAIGIRHEYFLVSGSVSAKSNLGAVGRPGWCKFIAWQRIGVTSAIDAIYPADDVGTIGIHHVDILNPTPVGLEQYLLTIR